MDGFALSSTPCPRCRELEQRVRELEGIVLQQAREMERLTATVERLTAALEEARRQGKRQAAPFSKGDPQAKPKRPGRKRGRRHGRHHRPAVPAEDQITETHRAPLPADCPHCGSPEIEREQRTVRQYQVELPVQPMWRKFEIERGTCRGCGHALQGRHPLQTSDATGAAAVMLGANAQAAVAFLNKTCGLSHGKVARVMRELFRIPLSRGGSARVVLRVGRRCEPYDAQVRAAVRNSPCVRADETGWRIGGRSAWLHALVGNAATSYLIRRSRGADVPAEVIGYDYDGLLLTDGWAPYEKFLHAVRAQCARHPLVRAEERLKTARGGAARFPRQVLALFQAALRCRRRLNRRRSPPASAARIHWYEHFTDELAQLVITRRSDVANRRFAKHLAKHLEQWFVFLLEPELEAANWPGEQAVRQAVVNRKVWGGSRTVRGAQAQGVLMSVLETCRRQLINPLEFLATLLCGQSPRLLADSS